MFGFLAPVGSEAAHPLHDLAALEAFWRLLPQDDPIAVQKAVCAALADVDARGSPTTSRLRALLALDQRAQAHVDALLVDFAAGTDQSASLVIKSWQAAFELCWSLGRAHGQFLRSARDSQGFRGCREYLPYVALRVFQHRQIELFLRPYVNEGPTRFSWKELHEVYRFVQSRGLVHHKVPINRCHSPSVADTTLEREYIHVLLQDLANGGHFAPLDAFRVSQSIPRWSHASALETRQVRSSEHAFVVDPDGDAGLVRMNRESAQACVCLDMASVLGAIGDEIASLRDAPGRRSQPSSWKDGRQLNLLRRLNVLCTPERPLIVRRGVRKLTALTVEVAVGMAQIVREMRDKPEDVDVAAGQAEAKCDDVASTTFDGSAEVPTAGSSMGVSTVTPSPPSPDVAGQPRLTMVDRSDSGCRLHGPALAGNPILPGGLIAFRENAASPWTVAVVRRVRKRLAGKRVEIGVEYLGNDPRRIAVVLPDSGASPEGHQGRAPLRVTVLYLRESSGHPVLPFKTLILPACGLAPEARLAVQSRTESYMIQLKAPLEEQADFTWSPFEILDRWPTDEPAPVATISRPQ